MTDPSEIEWRQFCAANPGGEIPLDKWLAVASDQFVKRHQIPWEE